MMLMNEAAPQAEHALRELFNGRRGLVRTGSSWRLMPHDLPPWPAVYQQTRPGGAQDVLKRWRKPCGRCCAGGSDVTPPAAR